MFPNLFRPIHLRVGSGRGGGNITLEASPQSQLVLCVLFAIAIWLSLVCLNDAAAVIQQISNRINWKFCHKSLYCAMFREALGVNVFLKADENGMLP